MREVSLSFAELGGRKFAVMVLIAMGVHLLALVVMHFVPSISVEEMRVKPIEFRIGAGGVLTPESEAVSEPAAVTSQLQSARKITSPAKKNIAKKTESTQQTTKPEQRQQAVRNNPSNVKISTQEEVASADKSPKRVRITAAPVSAEVPSNERRVPAGNIAGRLSPGEIEATKNVRQYGLPTLNSLFDNVEKEAENRNGAAAVGKSTQVTSRLSQQLAAQNSHANAHSPEIEAIRLRYEQQISSWVAQHRYYPKAAEGRSGRAIVRVRVDRQGYVRYYKVETSSGYAVFDSAAIDMVRRANPMPSAPKNYPAGNLIEFLIPITFKP